MVDTDAHLPCFQLSVLPQACLPPFLLVAPPFFWIGNIDSCGCHSLLGGVSLWTLSHLWVKTQSNFWAGVSNGFGRCSRPWRLRLKGHALPSVSLVSTWSEAKTLGTRGVGSRSSAAAALSVGSPRCGPHGVATAAMRGCVTSVLGGGGGSRRRQPSARAARRDDSGYVRPHDVGPLRRLSASAAGTGSAAGSRRRRRRVGAGELPVRPRPAPRRAGENPRHDTTPQVILGRAWAGTARRGPTCLWAVLGPCLLHLGLAWPGTISRPCWASTAHSSTKHDGSGRAVLARHGPSPSSISRSANGVVKRSREFCSKHEDEDSHPVYNKYNPTIHGPKKKTKNKAPMETQELVRSNHTPYIIYRFPLVVDALQDPPSPPWLGNDIDTLPQVGNPEDQPDKARERPSTDREEATQSHIINTGVKSEEMGSSHIRRLQTLYKQQGARDGQLELAKHSEGLGHEPGSLSLRSTQKASAMSPRNMLTATAVHHRSQGQS
uniref:Uncharacterized protein n=1 Tax=Oryza rufipogon TaxID=4529 RepID=A0A0E0NF63_ORYRU